MAKSISFHDLFVNHYQWFQTGAVNETLITLDIFLSAWKIFCDQGDMCRLDMEPRRLAEIKTRFGQLRPHQRCNGDYLTVYSYQAPM